MSASRSELLQSRQKQEAVAGNSECRLSRYRLVSPDLSVSDTNGILLFTMINLNLPAIKITLQQHPGIALSVGAQKIGRIAVIPFGIHRCPVRLRGNHQQTKRAGSRPPLPQNIENLFVPNVAPCSSEMNPARLPGDRLILSNRFRRKPLFAVLAPSSLRGRKTQPCIFPTTTDNLQREDGCQEGG